LTPIRGSRRSTAFGRAGTPAGTEARVVPESETWNPADIFPTTAAFDDARAALVARIPALDRYAGRLGESASVLRDALDEMTTLAKEFSRLYGYASMRFDEDTRVAARQGARQEVEIVGTRLARHAAYVRPEILALPRERIEAFVRELPGLAPHAHFLRSLVRQQTHVLDPSAERVLAEASLTAGGPSSIFGVLHNVELPRPELTLESGETIRLTPATFTRHRASCGRADRQRVCESYFEAYRGFTHTLGGNLFEGVKQHVFRARARNYPSSLASALDGDNVPESVYRNLIARVRENLPVLHRYFRLRARALGLDALEYHDLYGPLGREPGTKFDVATAKTLVLEAVAPLGDEYVRALDRAFETRWIDWHPGPGKRAGAYATGAAYDVHPYVLLNYNSDYESLTTLAHEMGHAMHSFLANRVQPYPTADYSIFLAEIASTFNEALLSDRLLREETARPVRIFLTSYWLDGMRATLFRQALFAEFELLIHETAERGEALTGESLTESYLALARHYHGHDAGVVRVPDVYGLEWATVPHFYYDFYVYQYATGIVAATSLAESVRHEPAGTRERYLALLSAGGSDDPLVLLRRAGVDLESDEPYAATFLAMERRMDELEALLDAE
jgi:oligoendopeptidase F